MFSIQLGIYSITHYFNVQALDIQSSNFNGRRVWACGGQHNHSQVQEK